MLDRIKSTAYYIRELLGGREPRVGIILGTGLGGLADIIADPLVLPYENIPYFPTSTVAGHRGALIFGNLGGKEVVAMQGRFHFYEGYSPEEVVFGVRVLKFLGVDTLLVSNAAGGLNPEFACGDLMIIEDHINFIPNPLVGPNNSDLGVRFPEMRGAYDLDLGHLAERLASQEEISLRRGCYVGTSGPSFETPAECRFFRHIGGDVVGMSTTPEVIAARHCGMRVFAMSVITNTLGAPTSHEEVQIEGARAAAKLSRLFTKIINSI